MVEARSYVIGIVSVAPITEVSGQGRVLAQLIEGAGARKAVFFSDAANASNSLASNLVRLSPAGRSFAASIRKRAGEIAVGAAQAGCELLIGCSGSPYDLTATALAAQYLDLPFVAYLFDDPVFQWTPGALRTAAARLSKLWLPLAKSIIVPNEFLAEDWRKRGAASVAVVRNAVAEIENAPQRHALAGLPGRPIVYTGSVYHAQADAFRNLLAALRGAPEFHLHVFTGQPQSQFVACGVSGPQVTWHGPAEMAEIPAIHAAATILLLPLGFDTGIPEAIRTAAPGKLGEYLRSGRPILAHVPPESFIAHFCRGHDCALVVDQPDRDTLIKSMRELARGGPAIERMAANAQMIAAQFRAEIVREVFWSIVEGMLAEGPRTPAKNIPTDLEVLPNINLAAALPASDNVPQGHPIALFVGGLAALQGPDLLVEAFGTISESVRDVHLVLVGPDRGMGALITRQVHALGLRDRVHILQSFDQSIDASLRQDLYRRAAVLVVPSRSEVLPMVALEAGATGVPLLATDRCNLEGLAEAGGGRVVAATATALAQGLSEMLSDRAGLARMGARLRALVLERYPWLDTGRLGERSVPPGVSSPHLPLPKVDTPTAVETLPDAGPDRPLPADTEKLPIRRQARRQMKLLLARVPFFERYISEKHVIAAERDQAVSDRDKYRILLKKERAATEALLTERDALLRAHAQPGGSGVAGPIEIASVELLPSEPADTGPENPLLADVARGSLKRRARLQLKRLLMSVPSFERYILEKRKIAAGRDQAVMERDKSLALLEEQRAAARTLRAERDALLRAFSQSEKRTFDRGESEAKAQKRPRPSHKILLVDFDIYSTIGGGQRFYRTVIERNPDAEFHYLSRGLDIEKKRAGALPVNAVPVPLRQTIDLAPFMNFESVLYFPRWIQHQGIYIAASVAGQHFDVVDVPSYIPVGNVLRHAFRLFGVSADRMAIALLGWLSVGIGNATEADQLQSMIAGLDGMERECLRAADLVYTISALHREENQGRHDGAIEVLDMHEVLDPPIAKPGLVAPPERPDLWFIGRLDRNKGPDLFVDIVARLPRSLYRTCFVSGPDGEVLGNKWSEQVIRRAGLTGVDLKYEGALDDEALVARAFDGGSVVIIPSRADSFNYVALEAISHSTPIMLSVAAGAVEFLREHHPELPVMTMRPDDLDAAAEALTCFLENYRENALAFRRAVQAMAWPLPDQNFLVRLYERAVPTPHPVAVPVPVAAPYPVPAMPTPYLSWDSDDPLLTIIVPTYRRPEWLLSCLASLAGARPRRTTVLVVDDGSPPEMHVPAIVAAFAPFAEVVSIANGGESNAMNVGLAHAKTPFVMMLGDDDVIEPSWPAEAIAMMASDDAVGVYPDWGIIDVEGKLIEEHHLVDCTLDRLVVDHWCLPGPATVFRRVEALAIGGRNRGIRFVGDYDFYLRLAMRGRLRHVPKLGGYWRLHAGNASMAKSRQLAMEHIAIIEAHLSECRRAGQPLARRQAQRARATAYMAAGVILARSGDVRSSYLPFARAWMLDRRVVGTPPANLTAYPQFYPAWLRRLNGLTGRH